MKQTLTPQEIIRGSGCYHQEKVNPVTKTSYAKVGSLTVVEFMENKDLPPQDRLWFLINGCNLNKTDKKKLIAILKKLHPKQFILRRVAFDDYVRRFNQLFYKEKKLTKIQVEKIIINFIEK
jgi:hypothetical protein